MKAMMKEISEICKLVFGYGIMIVLFAGGFAFFGYMAALIVGGDAAAVICEVIYKKIVPVIVYATNVLIVMGLVSMYLAGEKALTTEKAKTAKKY